MSDSPRAETAGCERFRNCLKLRARMQIDPRLQAKLSVSDLVQVTLTEAWEKRDQFRGGSDAEMAAWLGQILDHNIKDAIRKLHAQKGDIRKEVSLEEKLAESSFRVRELLADPISSPSTKAARQEELLRVADALERLTDNERSAIELRYLHSMTLAEIAAQMNKSESAVAGLLHRGLKRLRRLLDKQ